MTIGDRLRELRKEKRKTLRDVGLETGIDYSGLAQIERGERNCNTTTLEILSKYYHVSADYLLGNTEDKNSTSATDDITLAFYNQHGIVSEEQKNEIESFIKYVKSKNQTK